MGAPGTGVGLQRSVHPGNSAEDQLTRRHPFRQRQHFPLPDEVQEKQTLSQEELAKKLDLDKDDKEGLQAKVKERMEKESEKVCLRRDCI